MKCAVGVASKEKMITHKIFLNKEKPAFTLSEAPRFVFNLPKDGRHY
jgi:hypothetical protein